MKKLLLLKIDQHGESCYFGTADPRQLVKLATHVEMSETQDAQRPLSEKRVKDIASYVDSKNGILPNTLTLATRDNKITVNPYPNVEGLFYMEFPETTEEFNQYKNAIDVMDGQHRLYSFLDSIRTISDDIKFEIGFTLYIQPTLFQRRQIFVSCNEKQEKVSGNLLMWFREKLHMLSDNEKIYYNLIAELNNNYPLKNRIIMGAERIPRGFKADQVMDALKNAHIQDIGIGNKALNEEQRVKVICTYLTAWENVVGFKFSTSTPKEAGVAVKIAGLRYMLLLLQCIWERAMNLKKQFNVAFIEDTLKKMIAFYGVEREMFFTDSERKLYFRDRTNITHIANESANIIRSLGAEDFNPLC